MRGDSHVRFLGEEGVVTHCPYPTEGAYWHGYGLWTGPQSNGHGCQCSGYHRDRAPVAW